MARVDSYAAIALSRPSFPRAIDAIRSAMLPGMWLKSISFAPGRPSGDGEEGSAGTVRLVACGFKGELDEAVARPRRGRLVRGGSPGELFCNSLLAVRPKYFSSGSVVRETTTHGKRVAEIEISLALAHPLGTPDISWLPGRGGDEPAAEEHVADEAPDSVPEEASAEGEEAAKPEEDPAPAEEPAEGPAEESAEGEVAP